MSVEICFRLSIWPLQQLSALPKFHFLVDMDPRDASVDLLYQEHLLQWMTVVDLLGCGARGSVVTILVKAIATATPPGCDGQWHPEAAQQGHTEVLAWEF